MSDRWEITCEPDEGFSLDPVRPWRGYRLRYRPLGDRGRYHSVLVETDVRPPAELLQTIVDQYDAMRGR